MRPSHQHLLHTRCHRPATKNPRRCGTRRPGVPKGVGHCQRLGAHRGKHRYIPYRTVNGCNRLVTDASPMKFTYGFKLKIAKPHGYTYT